MNKKADEDFIGIKDVYALQCLATELKRNNINEILKSDYDILCKDYKKATKKIEKQENEIKSLKEQLEYLRSNEYLKQVKWERDINEKLNDDYKLVIEKLEKENKELKELNVCVGCEDNPTYKTRIDKAIEYIRQYNGHISGYYYSKEAKRFLVEENVKNDLLDILKGSDKE